MKKELSIAACIVSGLILGACALSAKTDADPQTQSMALNNEGFIQMQAGDYPRAQLLFEQALSLTPDLSIAHLNLGNVYQHTGRFSEAQAQYDLAVGTDHETESVQPASRNVHEVSLKTVSDIATHKLAELRPLQS